MQVKIFWKKILFTYFIAFKNSRCALQNSTKYAQSVYEANKKDKMCKLSIHHLTLPTSAVMFTQSDFCTEH